MTLLNQMDKNNPLYRSHVSILRGIHEQGTWDVYLHFCSWDCTVTRTTIEGILFDFKRAVDEWLSLLYGKDGFTTTRVTVRLFGLVFNKGVSIDPSVDVRYARYPVVREWDGCAEASPWKLSVPFKPYDSKFDLHEPIVLDNVNPHPEGCTGFQTKLWFESGRWNATAQRHYLHLGNVVLDTCRGRFGTNYSVLLHELGHAFFLDDLYDSHKFPKNMKCETCKKGGKERNCHIVGADSIMYASKRLTKLDAVMLRYVWRENTKRKKNHP